MGVGKGNGGDDKVVKLRRGDDNNSNGKVHVAHLKIITTSSFVLDTLLPFKKIYGIQVLNKHCNTLICC